MASSSNGTAPAIPKDGVQEELGSSVDRDRLFSDFKDGRVFTPYDISARRIDTMLKSDGKARAIEQALTLPLRAAPWDLLAQPGDKGERDFVYEALTRNANAGGMSTPFEMVISQATSACLYRRAYFERTWRYDDTGRLIYDKVSFRPAPTCRMLVDPGSGNFAGFKQRVPEDNPNKDDEGFVTIRPERAFVFIYGQHRRPLEGVSDLETAFGLFETKQKIKYLWANFLENQVMPKAVVSDTAGKAEANKLARSFATLKSGGVIGIDGSTQDAKPFETSIAAAQAFADAIRFLDSEMFASVLAGFLELASAASLGRGSYALSESQTDFFLQSRQAVLTELAAAVENYLIADLCRLNFPDPVVPVFKFGSLRAGDIQNVVTLLQALATAPQTSIPAVFIDELTIAAASALNLNADKVTAAIKERQAQLPATGTGQIQGATEGVMRLVNSLPQAVPH